MQESTFQPVLMTTEQREANLYRYEDFSSKTPVPCGTGTTTLDEVEEGQIGYILEADGDAEMTVTIDHTVYSGEASDDAASLHWPISDAKAGEVYDLYIPYLLQGAGDVQIYTEMQVTCDTPSESGTNISDSMLLAFVESDGFDYLGGSYVGTGYGYWQNAYGTFTEAEAGSVQMIDYMLLCEHDSSYDVYIDNLAISKAGASDADLLTAYDFYSGTSMATPFVMGAVGVIAGMYPEMNASGKTLLLSCTRYSEDLAGKVATNGVLDLPYLANPNPIVTDVWLDADRAVLVLTGSQLTQMQFTVNGDATVITLQT